MAKKPTQEEVDNMIQLYLEGHTINNIAKKLNRNEKTISKYLKENNIEIRQIKATQKIIDDVCKLYNSGLSEEKVGQKVNLCRKTVRNILKSNNITIKNNSEYRKYSINENYFDNIDSPNKAYILGLLYADGNVGLNNYIIQLALQSRDIDILNKIKEELNIDCVLYFDERSKKDKNHQDIYSLSFKNKHMHESLCKLGVIPRKTHVLKYPKFLDDNLHRHFLRGYMDGDGCIHGTELKSGRRSRAVDLAGTEDFCTRAKEIIEKFLNINCCILISNQDHPSTKKLVISGIYQSKIFLDWIYEDADMFLTRKYNTYIEKYVKELKEKTA